MNSPHEALHRFVVDRAGDSYRAAVAYDADDWTAIYIRGDLRTETLKQSIPDAVERARKQEPILSESEYPPLGAVTATTELHEAGALIHFREGENAGTLLSLGPEAASRLSGFVTECLRILESPSASRYEAEPESDRTGTD